MYRSRHSLNITYLYCCCTNCNSTCLSATQTFLCKLHSGAQQITTDIFHIIRLQGGWGHVPADELHCCVRWQFRQQRGGRENCVSCLRSLPEIQTGPTAAQAGSSRILDLSWAPTGAALKWPWPWLNVDPLLQTPSEQCFLWHYVTSTASLSASQHWNFKNEVNN